MSINEMEIKVNELRELRRMAEELAGEIAAIEDSLRYRGIAGEDIASGYILEKERLFTY